MRPVSARLALAVEELLVQVVDEPCFVERFAEPLLQFGGFRVVGEQVVDVLDGSRRYRRCEREERLWPRGAPRRIELKAAVGFGEVVGEEFVPGAVDVLARAAE